MQSGQNQQSGGIVAFIIVGVVLAGLLAGGIYLSKQQGQAARNTDTVAVNDTNSDDSVTESTPQDTAKDNDSNQEAVPREESNSPTSQPSQETQRPQSAAPQPTPQPAAPHTGPSADAGTATPNVPHTGPGSIASTGVEDAVVPAVALALATGGVLSYRRSSAQLRAAALRQ